MWILEVAENCVLSSLKFHVSVFHGAPRGSHAHFIKHEKCWLTQACHRGDEKGRSGITTRLCNARWLAIPNPLLSRLQDWMTIPSVCYFTDLCIQKKQNSGSFGRQNYALFLLNTNQDIVLQVPSSDWIQMLSSGWPPGCGPGRPRAQECMLVLGWTRNLQLFSRPGELAWTLENLQSIEEHPG